MTIFLQVSVFGIVLPALGGVINLDALRKHKFTEKNKPITEMTWNCNYIQMAGFIMLSLF